MLSPSPLAMRLGMLILAFGLFQTSVPRQTSAQVQNAFENPSAGATAEPVTLTLDEALQIALVQNYTVRSNRLDVANASAQLREAWGQLLPQIEASASYTRNIKSANPFAGSDAGSLFGSLGFVDWLAYNERARVDDQPSTEPIPFDEFAQRQSEGRQAAGFDPSTVSDNPFAVPNQFQNGITVTQTLFNGSAFAAVKGAQGLKDINQRGLDRQEQVLMDQVKQAFYGALLAQQQAQVTSQSTDRTEATLREVSRRVTQGVQPKFQRLSAEVELANLETQLVQAQSQAALAVDNFKQTLGIPIDQPVRLRGDLDVEDLDAFRTVSLDDAVVQALERRPDVEQARIAVELRRVEKNITRSEYLPAISAFANFNYTGTVPDNRTSFFQDPSMPDNPFQFIRNDRDFFSTDYWNPSIAAGMRLSWNLFNGFQTSARVQQRQIAVDQAQVQYEQLVQAVRLEVASALRNLQAASTRIASQSQNVDRAELNYEYAEARLREGVSSQLELRDASEQLDQSRLNYAQAMHDFLLARSAFETAVGVPVGAAATSDFQFTSTD